LLRNAQRATTTSSLAHHPSSHHPPSLPTTTGGTIDDGALSVTEPIADVVNAWTQLGCAKTAKLLFMVRLFMPRLNGLEPRDVVNFKHKDGSTDPNTLGTEEYLELARTLDPFVMQSQYIQAVYNVITGRLVLVLLALLPVEVAVAVAAAVRNLSRY
jgi:hypothetical protein